jgi:rifampicin phosphotransferase
LTYVMNLERIDRNDIIDVGAKGAHLGELMRIDGLRVPGGFCVTTDAFEWAVAGAPSIADRVDQLSRLNPDDREAIRTLSAEIRRAIEDAAIPGDVVSAIGESLSRFGKQAAFAVRSSATAEDLPGASFAGQYDSYLNIVGPEAILHHVRRCWASVFSERAVTYRRRDGFDDRDVRMAVVVQQLVAAEVAGVLFTADPVSSNRQLATVEATRGLGEALVSGLVSGDVYRVSDDVVVEALEQGTRPTLTEAQVIHLVQLDRRIEAHFGRPQDIEWCLVGDDLEFVQSRPITTLFPVPESGDGDNHVYVSVGHQQMMTDPMKPLGLSFWQLTTRSADRGRAANHPRARRVHPAAPRRRSPRVTVRRRVGPVRDRSGHCHRAGRAQRGIHRRLGTRHPDVVRRGAARLHPGRHPGAEADLVRSEEPSGVHVGNGDHVVAQRAAGGVAG